MYSALNRVDAALTYFFYDTIHLFCKFTSLASEDRRGHGTPRSPMGAVEQETRCSSIIDSAVTGSTRGPRLVIWTVPSSYPIIAWDGPRTRAVGSVSAAVGRVISETDGSSVVISNAVSCVVRRSNEDIRS